MKRLASRCIALMILLSATLFITGCPTMAGNIAYLEPMPKDLDEPAQGIELGRNCSPLLFDFVQDGLAALEKKTGIKYWSNVTMVYEAKAAVACLIFRGEPVVGGRK